jgi:tripartite-type tricarboxylate transporter receptor subunit TctC
MASSVLKFSLNGDSMSKLRFAIAAVLVVALGCPNGWSQTVRTIKFVNPFPPGGAADIVARIFAEQIGRAQDLATIVESRPGAGSVIGTEAVSRAAPDGNTLLVAANSFVINSIVRKLTYDPLSFEPICVLVRSPHVVTVNSASPYRTLADLLAAARAQPGTLTNASVGPATAQHIAFEMLKRAAKVDMVFIPFSGNAPAVQALLGGHVTSVIANYPEVAEHVKAGKLRALATTLGARIEEMPDVSTVAESGFTAFETASWFGLVAPPKTPRDTVAQLTSWMVAALQVPEVKAKLRAVGLFPVGLCGADFAAYLRKEYDDYGHIIRASNIKVE